jgi:hypothetical protein
MNRSNNVKKESTKTNSVMADAFKKAVIEKGYKSVNQYKDSLNASLKK